jgi:hypothetical protein
MRQAQLALVALQALLLPACHLGAPAASPAAPSVLPLRTLRLYETGIGYFERSGNASSATTLPVPAGHLDDALKSLVILSPDGQSRVAGLSFGSSLSKGMARVLAGLPQEGDAAVTYVGLLSSLKGAPIEVVTSGKEPVVGRLVEVSEVPSERAERRPSEGQRAGSAESGSSNDSESDADKAKGKGKGGPRLDVLLLVLTEQGELVRVQGRDIRSVRPLDAGFAGKLTAALDALSPRSAQATRPLRLLGESSGPVTFGYIAETPVWRTTYRVVLGGTGAGGTLQGWALLHNDTDEDWRDVGLQLVNGRPDSFLFPLVAPRYTRRELLHPDDELSTVPQLLDTTPDAMWSDSFGAGGLGLSGIGEGGGGRGEGFGIGSVGSVGHGASASSLLSVGNLASLAPAQGTESGALFSYAVARPISLAGHSSALVPFLDQHVEVEPVTWLADPSSPARAALRFANSTGQTLPAGTVAVFADGGFAGESTLDRLKPGQRRFIQFGADLDVEVQAHDRKEQSETRRVTFDHDVLDEHFLRTTTTTLDVESRAGRPRQVHIELRLSKNASVTGADSLDFDTQSGRPVVVFKLEPSSKISRTLTSVEGLARHTGFDALTAERLTALAAEPAVPAPERALLRDAAQRQTEREASKKAEDGARAELTSLDRDIERLREHLKAMGGEKGAAERNPFITRILATEDKLTAARKRLEGLEREQKARAEAVRAALAKLKP